MEKDRTLRYQSAADDAHRLAALEARYLSISGADLHGRCPRRRADPGRYKPVCSRRTA